MQFEHSRRVFGAILVLAGISGCDSDDQMHEAPDYGQPKSTATIIDGVISDPKDVDLIKLELTEGERYQFAVLGADGSFDPRLRVFGRLFRGNHRPPTEELGVGLDGKVLTFTPFVSGEHYLGVSARDNFMYNITTGAPDLVGPVPPEEASGSYRLYFSELR